MAKMAESATHMMDGIMMARRQRSELATEIKNATTRRHREVRSMLESLRASRGRATREQAAGLMAATRTRHADVHSFMQGLKTSRMQESKSSRDKARDERNGRRREVKGLLGKFGREQLARQKHRQNAAAAFMRDLTSGVASLLDKFDKSGRDRAVALRARFAGYAQDRREAVAIWRGMSRTSKPAAEASYRQSAESVVVHAAAPRPAEVPLPAATHGASSAAAQSSDATSRSGRHRGPGERHGGDSK